MATETMQETTARTRKRCPGCGKMIDVGERVVVTDDRYQDTRVHWFGRSYGRGAWHLWHPTCRAERVAREAELGREREERHRRELEEARAEREAHRAARAPREGAGDAV